MLCCYGSFSHVLPYMCSWWSDRNTDIWIVQKGYLHTFMCIVFFSMCLYLPLMQIIQLRRVVRSARVWSAATDGQCGSVQLALANSAGLAGKGSEQHRQPGNWLLSPLPADCWTAASTPPPAAWSPTSGAFYHRGRFMAKLGLVSGHIGTWVGFTGDCHPSQAHWSLLKIFLHMAAFAFGHWYRGSTKQNVINQVSEDILSIASWDLSPTKFLFDSKWKSYLIWWTNVWSGLLEYLQNNVVKNVGWGASAHFKKIPFL